MGNPALDTFKDLLRKVLIFLCTRGTRCVIKDRFLVRGCFFQTYAARYHCLERLSPEHAANMRLNVFRDGRPSVEQRHNDSEQVKIGIRTRFYFFDRFKKIVGSSSAK